MANGCGFQRRCYVQLFWGHQARFTTSTPGTWPLGALHKPFEGALVYDLRTNAIRETVSNLKAVVLVSWWSWNSLDILLVSYRWPLWTHFPVFGSVTILDRNLFRVSLICCKRKFELFFSELSETQFQSFCLLFASTYYVFLLCLIMFFTHPECIIQEF